MHWLPWLVSFRYSIASELRFWVDQKILEKHLRGRRTGKSCHLYASWTAGYRPCSQWKVEKSNLTRISSNIASGRYVNVCAVYLLVYKFVTVIDEFISDCMASLSSMVQLERPHINILSKMDLVTSKKDINKYLNSKPHLLIDLNQYMAPQFQKLNTCLMELMENSPRAVLFSELFNGFQVNTHFMVSFLPIGLSTEQYTVHPITD